MPFFGIELIDTVASETIDNPQFIGEHIKKRRLELKLFQSDVAKLLGVCEDTITGWENGRSFPQIQYYPKLIQFFGYNPFPVDGSTLSGRIKKFRIKQGVSYKKLGAAIGVNASTIGAWEANEHVPGEAKRKRLDDLMNQKTLSQK